MGRAVAEILLSTFKITGPHCSERTTLLLLFHFYFNCGQINQHRICSKNFLTNDSGRVVSKIHSFVDEETSVKDNSAGNTEYPDHSFWPTLCPVIFCRGAFDTKTQCPTVKFLECLCMF